MGFQRVAAVASIVLVTALCLAADQASALPFAKGSGVTELTPKTMKGFLNTHKPVFIMFYAPWCGHCKSMHPDYTKFGKGLQDVVKVGAIDADKYKEIGGQYNVKGFPTIKYWGMGAKKNTAANAKDFQQARNAKALRQAALQEINPKAVIKVSSEAELKAAMQKASSGRAVVLASAKGSVPPLYSVLAASPTLQGTIAFVFVQEKSKALVNALEVDAFPTITLVGEANDALALAPYKGAIEYMAIAKHIQAQLGGEGPSETPEAPKGSTEEPAAEESEDAAGKAPVAPAVPASKPKAALPVSPVPLTKFALEQYCSSKAQRLNGRAPLCVVSMRNRDLSGLFSKYNHDSVLFFTVSEDADDHSDDDEEERDTGAVNEVLAEQLGLKDGAFQKDDVLFLRAFRESKAKFLVIRGQGLDRDNADLDGHVQRVLEGTVTFQRADAFPKL